MTAPARRGGPRGTEVEALARALGRVQDVLEEFAAGRAVGIPVEALREVRMALREVRLAVREIRLALRKAERAEGA
jgi:hypothetical protein